MGTDTASPARARWATSRGDRCRLGNAGWGRSSLSGSRLNWGRWAGCRYDWSQCVLMWMMRWLDVLGLECWCEVWVFDEFGLVVDFLVVQHHAGYHRD